MNLMQKEMGTKEITSIALGSEDNVMVSTITTPRDKRERYSLNNHELFRVAHLGLEIEKQMESPQDVEWCIRPDGEIVILQSRPITTLKIL